MAKVNLRPSPILTPFAAIYAAIVGTRNWLFEHKVLQQYTPNLPVISVGGATAGGSGKTPFTRHLALLLYKEGYKPVILSRGYGGTEHGPLQVTREDSARRVGDEALMQVNSVGSIIPVVVSRLRSEGVRFIAAKNLGNIVILDDGHQHRRLKRHINLLLLDNSTLERRSSWLNGKLLPAGYLREPLKAALERADVTILISKSDSSLSAPKELGELPSFSFQLKPGALVNGRSGDQISPEQLQRFKFSAVTAIADPESFFSLLVKQGIVVSQQFIYKDHALFSAADAKLWLSGPDGAVLCTEKDLLKVLDVVPSETAVIVLPLIGTLSTNNLAANSAANASLDATTILLQLIKAKIAMEARG